MSYWCHSSGHVHKVKTGQTAFWSTGYLFYLLSQIVSTTIRSSFHALGARSDQAMTIGMIYGSGGNLDNLIDKQISILHNILTRSKKIIKLPTTMRGRGKLCLLVNRCFTYRSYLHTRNHPHCPGLVCVCVYLNEVALNSASNWVCNRFRVK